MTATIIPTRVVDMTGKVVARLTVRSYAGIVRVGVTARRYQAMWNCICQCGNKIVTSGQELRSGQVVSCGCKRREGRQLVTHGRSRTRLYATWYTMKARCYNPKNPRYHRYGGRGIAVCKSWHRFEAFARWADKSGYRAHLTIDRRNNDGGYRPANCRWVTKSFNSSRRSNP